MLSVLPSSPEVKHLSFLRSKFASGAVYMIVSFKFRKCDWDAGIICELFVLKPQPVILNIILTTLFRVLKCYSWHSASWKKNNFIFFFATSVSLVRHVRVATFFFPLIFLFEKDADIHYPIRLISVTLRVGCGLVYRISDP